jgi:hypothetical protein
MIRLASNVSGINLRGLASRLEAKSENETFSSLKRAPPAESMVLGKKTHCSSPRFIYFSAEFRARWKNDNLAAEVCGSQAGNSALSSSRDTAPLGH